MRDQFKVLTEKYEEAAGNSKTLIPVRGTYLYFVKENELYQLNPYKQVQPEGMIMTLATSWRMARVIQGEDAQDLGYQVTNPAQWYEARFDAAPDHVYEVYIGG